MKRTLIEINADYENILHSSMSDYDKSVKFARIMTEMEHTYHVPLLRNVAWEQENRAVIALYRKISMSRRFDD